MSDVPSDRLIRSNCARAILSQVKEGSLLLQMALVPETRRQYDFPHFPGMHTYLLVPDNPYLDCMIYQVAYPDHTHASTAKRETSVVQSRAGSNSLYTKPMRAASMIDPLLSKVTVAVWTSIINNDEVLRRLLSTYFLYVYPFSPSFQKDYFLDDMAKGRTRFCSSLLVNTILAFACHRFWNPYNLAYQFLVEDKRLWELETV